MPFPQFQPTLLRQFWGQILLKINITVKRIRFLLDNAVCRRERTETCLNIQLFIVNFNVLFLLLDKLLHFSSSSFLVLPFVMLYLKLQAPPLSKPNKLFQYKTRYTNCTFHDRSTHSSVLYLMIWENV